MEDRELAFLIENLVITFPYTCEQKRETDHFSYNHFLKA